MGRIHRVLYNTRILGAKEITVLGDARSIIDVVQVILDVFSPDTLYETCQRRKKFLTVRPDFENLLSAGKTLGTGMKIRGNTVPDPGRMMCYQKPPSHKILSGCCCR